jgi:hypothetical protein
MHVPRRFILGLACGLLLAMGVFVALLYTQLGVATLSAKWAHDIMEKKRALAEAAPGPRLLLVGGSGTTFGLSAQEIQKRTGRQTLNMGTHAGLNLDYILYWARQVARPGDTVLLVPEYELYVSDSWEARDNYILAYDPAFFHRMSFFDKIAMATRVPFKRIQKGFANRRKPEPPPRPHPPYTDGASFIDEFGDETGNPAAQRPAQAANLDIKSEVLVNGLAGDDDFGFDQIREFLRWATAHQVKVLATFPNIRHQPEYDTPKADEAIKTITDFYKSLGIPVVGNAREVMLPSDQFFDTYYHLTREAAVERTDRLVPELKPYLDADK